MTSAVNVVEGTGRVTVTGGFGLMEAHRIRSVAAMAERVRLAKLMGEFVEDSSLPDSFLPETEGSESSFATEVLRPITPREVEEALRRLDPDHVVSWEGYPGCCLEDIQDCPGLHEIKRRDSSFPSCFKTVERVGTGSRSIIDLVKEDVEQSYCGVGIAFDELLRLYYWRKTMHIPMTIGTTIVCPGSVWKVAGSVPVMRVISRSLIRVERHTSETLRSQVSIVRVRPQG